MESPRFCSFCSALGFDFLRGPTLKDLHNLRAGSFDSSQHPFSNRWGPVEYTKIGTIDRIRKSSKTCQLCLLFIEILDREGVPERLKKNGQEDEIVFTQLMSFVRYRWPEDTLQDYYTRRLDLFVGDMFTDRTRRSYSAAVYNCVQTCEIGGSSRDSEGPFVERKDPQRLMFAGRKRPALINMEWPRRWMQKCLQSHGADCVPRRANKSGKVSVFRLIDVHKMCIRTFINVDWKDPQYTALSYVWGMAGQQIMLKNENVRELEKGGSVEKRCSQTIKDAAQVTRELGLNYIWVDALCIIQDNLDDKKIQIGNMATIYRSAILTIVAAAGQDAKHGLPGLNKPRTMTQKEVVVRLPSKDRPGFSLMPVLSISKSSQGHPLEGTVWNSRGWTYQESVLSRRTLEFSEQQIFWSCRRAQWSEGVDLDDDAIPVPFEYSDIKQHQPALDPGEAKRWRVGENQYLSRLASMIYEFNLRNLSFEGDRFDAFAAVMEEYSELSDEYLLWGLPCFRFELALCWETSRGSGVSRRTALTTLPTTSLNRRVPFPSWSWIGWSCDLVMHCDDTDIELGMSPAVSAYVLRNNPLRLLRVNDIKADNEGVRTRASSALQEASMVTLQQIRDRIPNLTIDKLSDTPDDQLIFFWTETAFFYSGYKDHEVHDSLRRKIMDNSGKVVGESGTWPDGHVARDKDEVNGPYEFIAVVYNRIPIPPTRVRVLQIERKDGIAYRVNSGDIEEEAWMKAKRDRILVAMA